MGEGKTMLIQHCRIRIQFLMRWKGNNFPINTIRILDLPLKKLYLGPCSSVSSGTKWTKLQEDPSIDPNNKIFWKFHFQKISTQFQMSEVLKKVQVLYRATCCQMYSNWAFLMNTDQRRPELFPNFATSKKVHKPLKQRSFRKFWCLDWTY